MSGLGRYIDEQTGELKTCYLTTIDVLGLELEAINLLVMLKLALVLELPLSPKE